MSSRGKSAEDLSHLTQALRAPLNHAIGYAEILLEEVKGEACGPALERIVALARCICDLIALTSSRGESPARDVAELRERMRAHTQGMLSELEALSGCDQRDVERIRTAVYELVEFAEAGTVPAPGGELLPAKVHMRGDSLPPAGRLLVADNDENNRDLLRRHLRKQGYYVEQAADGATALAQLKSGSFDAVLLDLAMPGMNGLQVLETIRADEQLGGVAVLMISAAGDLDAIANSIQRGAEDYLLKPFDPVLLNARLRATLERKRLRDHERTRSLMLQQVTGALQRSNEDLQRFAYAASHDLQAPVRTITTYLQLLERRLGPRIKEDEREMIGFAQAAAKRMHNLIQDLLAYSRAGTTPLKMEQVDTAELVATLVDDLKAVIDEAGAKVSWESLPVVVGDRTGIRQILSNLLNNAVKYRSVRPPVIDIYAAREDDHWRLCVRDNGEGIAPEYNQQIFEMFKRLHGEEVPGSGIGLAICKRIVDRFGGKIWAASEVGRGSTFCFTVPSTEKSGTW